jgi:hypothetical protein
MKVTGGRQLLENILTSAGSAGILTGATALFGHRLSYWGLFLCCFAFGGMLTTIRGL